MNPDRRRTLGALAAGLAAGSTLGRAAEALAIPGPQPSPKSGPSRAVVTLARRPGVRDASGALEAAKLRDGLGAAVARAVGETDPVVALRRLFRPADIVGIKVNGMGGRGLSPRPEIALQLALWLQAAGVPAGQIVVFDRSSREVQSGGYASLGLRTHGVDGNFDGEVRRWGPEGSRFARLLVDELTALLNLGILKDHSLSGVSVGLKNWYGVVDNPSRLHAESCNPFIPHLASYPLIARKLRLTVIDATTAQCEGGPTRSPRWAWPFEGLLASIDPVAIDAFGLKLIDERRVEVGLRPLRDEGRDPRYIEAAARLGLGVADSAKIAVEQV